MSDEPDAEPVFRVLSENIEVLSWFMRMQTQWDVGMNGLVGLKYLTFIQWAKDEGVRRKDRVWMLDDLRLMEGEFLTVMRSVS